MARREQLIGSAPATVETRLLVGFGAGGDKRIGSFGTAAGTCECIREREMQRVSMRSIARSSRQCGAQELGGAIERECCERTSRGDLGERTAACGIAAREQVTHDELRRNLADTRTHQRIGQPPRDRGERVALETSDDRFAHAIVIRLDEVVAAGCRRGLDEPRGTQRGDQRRTVRRRLLRRFGDDAQIDRCARDRDDLEQHPRIVVEGEPNRRGSRGDVRALRGTADGHRPRVRAPRGDPPTLHRAAAADRRASPRRPARAAAGGSCADRGTPSPRARCSDRRRGPRACAPTLRMRAVARPTDAVARAAATGCRRRPTEGRRRTVRAAAAPRRDRTTRRPPRTHATAARGR